MGAEIGMRMARIADSKAFFWKDDSKPTINALIHQNK